MMARLVNPAPTMPLFTWPEQVEIAALTEQREQIVERMAKLPRFSHRRVVLAARLRELTERQLLLEGQMRRRASQ